MQDFADYFPAGARVVPNDYGATATDVHKLMLTTEISSSKIDENFRQNLTNV